MDILTSQQKETFDRDGYLVVKGLLKPVDLAPLIGVAAQVVDQQTQALFAEGRITERHEDQPFDKRWYEVYRQCASEQPQYAWHTVVFSQALFNLITHPRVLDLIESFVGQEIQFNGDFWVRPKLPSERVTTLPWHQNSAYMPKTENDFYLSLWIPLVDVNEHNGTLQYIPGSHRQGLQAMHNVEGERFKVPVQVPRRFQWYIAEWMLSLPTAKWSMVISFFSGVMASGFAFGCAKDTVEFFNAGIGEVRFPVGEGFLLVIFDYVGPWV